MQEDTTIHISLDGLEITLTRFDEEIDQEHGVDYHGFYIYIKGSNLDITARKYDFEDEINIQKGITQDEISKIDVVRKIGARLFNCSKLTVLGSDATHPYQTV